jgi:hypothetical protein
MWNEAADDRVRELLQADDGLTAFERYSLVMEQNGVRMCRAASDPSELGYVVVQFVKA